MLRCSHKHTLSPEFTEGYSQHAISNGCKIDKATYEDKFAELFIALKGTTKVTLTKHTQHGHGERPV